MDRFTVTADFCETVEEPPSRRKKRRVKKKKTETEFTEYTSINVLANIQDVYLITISVNAQTAIGCTIGTDVTALAPWKYVSKVTLINNVETQESMSEEELLNFKDKLEEYPNPDILICYKSDNEDFDAFYVCCSPEAEAAGTEVMDAFKAEIVHRLNLTIYKTIRPWKSLGSENEVDLQISKLNRPLLELEVESEYPIMTAKCLFKLKMVEDRRDGYATVLMGRTAHRNVIKRRVDTCTQVSPSLTSQYAQTTCTFSKNVWTQYKYEYIQITELPKETTKNLNNFVNTKSTDLQEFVRLNGHINFYTDDYITLTRGCEHRINVLSNVIGETFSFFDYDTCKGKKITDVSWHSMWTGTVAIAYSTKSLTAYTKGKLNVDEVAEAIYNVSHVLLWCFNDSLVPKLYLETPREVSALSFCPYDENLLVGGCINGQIVIWDITNKIDKVEKQEILTVSQQNYRNTMNSLIKWMKNTRNISVVRANVVSNLPCSHGSRVTSIKWISPFREISKSGQIKDIPESENRSSLQFLTSSTDGTMLAWNIKVKVIDDGRSLSRNGNSRLKSRPEGLMKDVSPYNVLNRVFKPLFKVNIIDPQTNRSIPLTHASLAGIPFVEYKEKFPNSTRKYNKTDRVYYEPICTFPITPLVNEFIGGTIEGDFLTVSWKGFSFNPGEEINMENGKIDHIYKFHDGPLVSVSRSRVHTDLVLTVGGKTFALWLLKELDEPVFWRRSPHKYSFGIWNTYMPSVFRLTRSDGSIERWVLRVRSDRAVDEKELSGGSLGATFTHPFLQKEHIIGVSDYNAFFRLLSTPGVLCENEHEKWDTYNFCKREVDRKLKIRKWQQQWNDKNVEFIRLKKEEELSKKQHLKEQEGKRRTQKLEEIVKVVQDVEKVEISKDEKWRKEEEERMHRTIMCTKNLNIEELKRLQVPLLKIQKANDIKNLKLKDVLKRTDDYFSNAVQRCFPDVLATKHALPPDPYVDVSTPQIQSQLYEEYETIKKASKAYIRHNKYDVQFDWSNMMKKGIERKKLLDGFTHIRSGEDCAPTVWSSVASRAIHQGDGLTSPQHSPVCVNYNSDDTSPRPRKYRKVRRIQPQTLVHVKPRLNVHSFCVTGVEKLTLSTTTQEALGCLAGVKVTFEYPWTRITKESIQNSIESDPFSEFAEFSEIIESFPNQTLLIIFIPNDEIEEQEFYICLTVEAEEIVSNLIEQMIVEREEYIKTVGLKVASPWRSLGSEEEIFGLMNINNRPLIEVELTTAYPLQDTPAHFCLRMVEDAQDGYVEVLSRRSKFKNTQKMRIDVFVQSTPTLNTVTCQSYLPYPKNVSTEYEYSYEPVTIERELLKRFKFFTNYGTDGLFASVMMNSYFDFYTNDYKNLIKNRLYLAKVKPDDMVEFTSLYHHNLEKHKLLSAVSWHPMWSGVVATAYSYISRCFQRHSKLNIDETLSSMYNLTPVLIWTLFDPLSPSLFLETPREITSLSFCPYNENLLVGGCTNGQVIIWDIAGRLEYVEKNIVLTAAQLDHKKRLENFTSWMKFIYDPKIVRATVISDLKNSHKAAITEICWVSPYNEITREGKVKSIPENQSRSSLQFTTVSLDGSILVWNLGGVSSTQGDSQFRRAGRLQELPEGLRSDTSPFKVLNRILKPLFIGNVIHPTTLQPIAISFAARQISPVSYMRKSIERSSQDDRTRDLYKPVFFRSSMIEENTFVLGSSFGEVLKISWEGFDFKSSEFITSESCRISNLIKFHDGTIVSLAACSGRSDLILSVGGKTFALWLLDYPNKPIIWKRSKYTYTFGKWANRQAVIVLSRSDGCLEVWNFSIKSNKYQFLIPLSREAISGLHVHTLPLKNDVVGLSDYTQSLRLYYIKRHAKSSYKEENERFEKIIANELRKKITIDKWNTAWNQNHADLIKIKRMKLIENQRKRASRLAKMETQHKSTQEVEDDTSKALQQPSPDWIKIEVDIMKYALLCKRGVDVDLIKEQQKPLIQIQKELKEKRRKLKLYSHQAENIFEDTLETHFASVVEDKPCRASDPYGGGDYTNNAVMYMNNYKNIQKTYGKYVKSNRYEYEFNWLKMLQRGEERRKLLDVWDERCAHKSRRLKEKYIPEIVRTNIMYSSNAATYFNGENDKEIEEEMQTEDEVLLTNEIQIKEDLKTQEEEEVE
ncbi:hypothetical protein FQR65_LT11649 [Abscondita terminalis]|nr:hypothetical protein FQR65_LT11649 [Abscondita terminalis]